MWKFNDRFDYSPPAAIKQEDLQAAFKKKFIPLLHIPLEWEGKQLIGIEVEVEQVNNVGKKLMYWDAINDGSLRDNGVEYRTKPFHIEYTPFVLNELFNYLNTIQKGYVFSERCSIHVHFDFRQYAEIDLLKLLIIYLSLEIPLFKFGSPQRFKNTFCVPVQEFLDPKYFNKAYQEYNEKKEISQDTIINIIKHSFQGKYAALNILPLLQFIVGRDPQHKACGTIEFRQLHGTTDIEHILRWINILFRLIKYVVTTDITIIKKYILSLNTSSEYDVFLRAVFEEQWQWLMPPSVTFSDFSKGISFAKQAFVQSLKLSPDNRFLKSNLAEKLQKNIQSGKKEIKGDKFNWNDVNLWDRPIPVEEVIPVGPDDLALRVAMPNRVRR